MNGRETGKRKERTEIGNDKKESLKKKIKEGEKRSHNQAGKGKDRKRKGEGDKDGKR